MWPLYAGGLIGPFGGTLTTPMLPELAGGLDTRLATVALAMPTYLVPFAAVMLVSGTLGETWGRARTVRWAYVGYAVASLACAVAPDAGTFLAGRALQGTANAFTSPLLVAAISDVVPPARLSRALGLYGGWQAAGQAFGPLVGGLAAAVDWRWAFVASAAAALALATMPPRDPAPSTGRRDGPGPARMHPGVEAVPVSPVSRWRALANRRLALACGVGFGLYLSTGALLLLGALLAGDRFGLGPDARGVLVASFGVAGLLTAGALGRVADRVGIRGFGVAVLVVLTAAVAAAGWVPTVWLLAAAVAVAGVASTAGRVVVNTLAVTSTPTNRGGATSMTLSWQFLGSALAPVTLLPVYAAHPSGSFAAAAAGSLVAAGLLLVAVARRRRRVGGPGGPARPTLGR